MEFMIRAMPWGPPLKGAHQTFKNNANEERSVTITAQPSSDNKENGKEVAYGAP